MTVDAPDTAVKVAAGKLEPTMRAGDGRTLKGEPVPVQSPYILGVVVFVMMLSVIGTHGLLSGTATMDFAGKKGTGMAVGIIDGFVYLGTAVESFALGYLTTKSWTYWPLFLVPFGVVGLVLCRRIWDARAGKAH
jgi:sugar phosphate permease